jgi:predicted MPP superfamily phosphohydrolase
MDIRHRIAAGAVSSMKLLGTFVSHMEIGARRPLLVRRETVAHMHVRKRVLFASDLHLRKNGPPHIVDGLVEIASKERPDLILLGGDLVDWRRSHQALESLVCRLSRVGTVAAIAGNHDRWIGVGAVRAAVLAGGGLWLEDAPWFLTADCVVYGSCEQRIEAASHHVLCTHHPGPSGMGRHFDLTLSGHLHGGQFVFYEWRGRFYPGAFLYRWNGLRFDDHNGQTLLISRGVQDTLPLRWNCPREVLIVDI